MYLGINTIHTHTRTHAHTHTHRNRHAVYTHSQASRVGELRKDQDQRILPGWLALFPSGIFPASQTQLGSPSSSPFVSPSPSESRWQRHSFHVCKRTKTTRGKCLIWKKKSSTGGRRQNFLWSYGPFEGCLQAAPRRRHAFKTVAICRV